MAPTHAVHDDSFDHAVPYLAAAIVGGLLLGASPRGRAGSLLRVAGIALIGAAFRPLFETQVRTVGERRQRVSTRTSVDIDRPVAEVFAFFKDFENFPKVSDSFQSVIDHQDGRSHWEVFTPSGRVLAWDAVVTKYVPNVVIAWQSIRGSVVDMSGLVRFTPLSAKRTHIDMDLSYALAPGQTDLGDAFRALVRTRPARRLDSTLQRTRAYIESRPAAIVEPEPPRPETV